MDFESYFEATEQAFAEEKEELIDRTVEVGKSWADTVQMEEDTIAKSRELLSLKKILRKSHLQILRTKEEALIMELKNSQLGFQVRQLQSELFRLLPFSHSYVPSTEYYLSMDADTYKPTPKHTVKSDAQHIDELKQILKKWQVLSQVQGQVFDEERKKALADDVEWRAFCEDYLAQNAETHAMIDDYLRSVTKKLVALQQQHESVIEKHGVTIAERDKEKSDLHAARPQIHVTIGTKAEDVMNKARADACEKCGTVRGRVRQLERNNLAKFSAIKEVDHELLDRSNVLLKKTGEMSEKLMKSRERNKSLHEDGSARLTSLEEKLNAVISSASAVRECEADEEMRILNHVTAAVGKHARSTRDVEQLHRQIKRMGRQLQEVV
jgi:hypothetical protein